MTMLIESNPPDFRPLTSGHTVFLFVNKTKKILTGFLSSSKLQTRNLGPSCRRNAQTKLCCYSFIGSLLKFSWNQKRFEHFSLVKSNRRKTKQNLHSIRRHIFTDDFQKSKISLTLKLCKNAQDLVRRRRCLKGKEIQN